MELKRLFLAYGALLALLVATIAASFLPIGAWRQVIALTIAGEKAAFILWIFMELRRETPLVRLMAGVAGVLLLVMTMMLAADYHLRPWTPTGNPAPSRVALVR